MADNTKMVENSVKVHQQYVDQRLGAMQVEIRDRIELQSHGITREMKMLSTNRLKFRGVRMPYKL